METWRRTCEQRTSTGRKETRSRDEIRAWERKQSVTEIIIREGESFEAALKKFTRRVQQDGLLSEAKRRQHYEPPSVKRKRKADARERKARKARMKAAAMGY
jgi:small subunit ribosomal protein S21